MGEWQPIETAPRDGAWLLLLDERESDDGQRHYVGRWGSFGEWAGPYADGYECGLEDIGVRPSHWMPLPALPSAGNGSIAAAAALTLSPRHGDRSHRRRARRGT